MNSLSADAAPGTPEQYGFEPLEHTFDALSSREGAERMTKWGLANVLQAQRFRFTGRFQDEAAGDFLGDLLRAPAFAAALNRDALPLPPGAAARFDSVPCTVLNMGFFDALHQQGLMAETGYLKKCLPDPTEDHGAGVDVENVVMDMLLNPNSEHAEAFPAEQRAEFIFALFHTLFVGGVMHQRGDYATEYLETTRALYKQLLTVHKAARSGKVEITSKVFRLAEPEEGATALFPHESKHNRCFVVVDPVKKYATVLYVPYRPFW